MIAAKAAILISLVAAGTALVITGNDGWVFLPIIGFLLVASD